MFDFIGLKSKSSRDGANNLRRTVFISYNSVDEHLARLFADWLEKDNISSFFSKRSIKKGEIWNAAIESAIKDSSVIVFLLGSQGFSPGQKDELELTKKCLNARTFGVIPILLPGHKGVTKIPRFLRKFQAVDLRQDFAPEALEFKELVKAIEHYE